MTIHKSKGMEFPIVFIIGMCERVMPHHKAHDLEEERRIVYVAATRAQEELYTSAIYEKFNSFKTKPSRFLEEMGVTFPDWYLGKLGQRKVPKKLPEPTYTKYDEKGNIVTTMDINPGTFPGEVEQLIDTAIGDKYFDRDSEGNLDLGPDVDDRKE